MEEILIAVLSSTVLSTLINFLQTQRQQRHQRAERQETRDQTVADRYYDELRQDIEELKRQLKDSEHRADKWQELYYQLYAKYQSVKAQNELFNSEIRELKTQLQRLEKIITAKEQKTL